MTRVPYAEKRTDKLSSTSRLRRNNFYNFIQSLDIYICVYIYCICSKEISRYHGDLGDQWGWFTIARERDYTVVMRIAFEGMEGIFLTFPSFLLLLSLSLSLSLSLFSFPVSLVRFHGLLIANLPNNRDAITRFFSFFFFSLWVIGGRLKAIALEIARVNVFAKDFYVIPFKLSLHSCLSRILLSLSFILSLFITICSLRWERFPLYVCMCLCQAVWSGTR